MSNTKKLIDNHGRRMRKLRVSLLDACNFRCFYCMPEKVQFMKSSQYLSAKEIVEISRILISYGMEQIRLTGGEPLLRKEFREIVSGLNELPLKKLGLTTNGHSLLQELSFLKETKCQNINISLDSLKEKKFNLITKRDSFKRVYKGILKARDDGFNVKLNVVLLKSINDNEILDFIRFSKKEHIEVRFLELMRIGEACGRQDHLFLSVNETIKMIKSEFPMRSVSVDHDSTSFNYEVGDGARIGFIASETKPFCNACSRWRLTADGSLRACLMSEDGINLKGKRVEEYEFYFSKLLRMKPTYRIESIAQNMNQIGG